MLVSHFADWFLHQNNIKIIQHYTMSHGQIQLLYIDIKYTFFWERFWFRGAANIGHSGHK